MSEPRDQLVAAVIPNDALAAFRDAYNSLVNTANAHTALMAGITAAAPFIVAANQPEPAHEVTCPQCGATIRARMADQPDGDLREALAEALSDSSPGDLKWADATERVRNMWREDIDALLPVVESFVAAREAAARVNERAQIARELVHEAHQRGDLDHRTTGALAAYVDRTTRWGLPGSIQRALTEEADRG